MWHHFRCNPLCLDAHARFLSTPLCSMIHGRTHLRSHNINVVASSSLFQLNPLTGVGTFLHHARFHWAGVGVFMHHPERRSVYYGFSQVQPTKVFVEGNFKSHTFSLCFPLPFMASRAKISSDPAVVWEHNIMEVLSCDSESDDDSERNCSWGSRTGRAMLAGMALALDRRPYRRRSIRASRIAIYELRATHARPTF